MKQNEKAHWRFLKQWINWRLRALSLLTYVVMLSGCASSPTVIAPSCPEPTPIPVTLSESDLPAAQNYSKKVQNYVKKVQDFLER